jgi:uncharacterized membrane protein
VRREEQGREREREREKEMKERERKGVMGRVADGICELLKCATFLIIFFNYVTLPFFLSVLKKTLYKL